MKKIIYLSLSFILVSSIALAEVKIVSQSYAKLMKCPGSFCEVAELLKKGAEIEAGDADETGKWLKVKAVIAATGGKEGVVKSFKAGEEPWVSASSVAGKDSGIGTIQVASAMDAIQTNEASSAASIRGMDNDVEKFLKQGEMKMEVAKFILAPKFAASDYFEFRKSTLPDGRFQSFYNIEERPAEKITVVEADKVGITVAMQLSKSLGKELVRDPGLNSYVGMIAALLGEASMRSDINYRVVIIDDPEINTFSAPGGYIVLTTGLIAACPNEAGLAGALAHEVAHIALDHGMQERKNLKKETGVDVVGMESEMDQSRSSRSSTT
jgi:hypothetical protein